MKDRGLSLRVLLAISAVASAGASASKILVIGDSMGDYSCGNPEGLGGMSFLTDFCAGAEVVNVAVSGSTAVQWAENQVHHHLIDAGMKLAGKGVTHIWMSLGGNDYMNPGENAPQDAPGIGSAACEISTANLVARLDSAVQGVSSAVQNSGMATSTTKIVLVGYCQPFVSQCSTSDMKPLNDALKQVADAAGESVEFHDISSRCGGKPSDKSYFVADGLHLNRKGYCSIFSDPSVQSAFNCGPATYDCAPAFGTCKGASGGGRATSGGAKPQVYTFPVKSQNLDSAMAVQFYQVNEADLGIGTVTDLHAVHGIQTHDGGYIMCGKGLESEAQGAPTESFCIKYNAAGGTSWAWKSNLVGLSDAANAVANLGVNATEVAVVGYRSTNSSVGRRYITKLDVATGTEVWTTTDFGDDAAKTSFFEMIEVSGDDVYLAGGINKNNIDEMSFKSYGNVADGQATVQHMPLAALQGASKPTKDDVTWTYTNAAYLTAKAARPVNNGNLAVLLYGELENKHSSVVMLKQTNADVVWGPINYDAQGEGTDLQVSLDMGSFIIAGQGLPEAGELGSLYGQLTKVNATDGTRTWTQSYGSCGPVGKGKGCNKRLIFNECWGGLVLPDGGYAMACGTGIEKCDPNWNNTADKTDCAAKIGDRRPGAYKRGASVWQSMIVRTDTNGELQWLRVDSYRAEGAPALGSAGWTASSSAAEWIVNTADGGLAAITDQVSGTGLIKLGGSEKAATANPGTNPDPAATSPAPSSVAALNAKPEWTWVKSPKLCAGWIKNCKNAQECTRVAYGPCAGGTTSKPETYLTSEYAGLIYADENKYLKCSSTTCSDLKLLPATSKGYRDTAMEVELEGGAKYAYTMSGNTFGDMVNSGGMYNGIASYLNIGSVDIKTSFNNLYMATGDSTARVNRVADDGSMIGAPIGPFDACIADINTESGDCLGERVFKPSEYKFSVFGYAAGEQYDSIVKAGQNGFPAGMDKVGVRMKLSTVGLTELAVNGREYDPKKVDENVIALEFMGEKGGISVAFPTKYNIGTMAGLDVPMSAQKEVHIKLHSLDVESGTLYLDYLFDVASIKAGNVFVYDPTVKEVGPPKPASSNTPAPSPSTGSDENSDANASGAAKLGITIEAAALCALVAALTVTA